ncbi:MAG: glycosyltransferase family 2 protein [Planctomycetales bacterium]|nr:glycosyltransferase family 2 protein [Planctomycetales bacterium]
MKNAVKNSCRTIDSLAAVVIGRNEGERLTKCLHSLAPQVAYLVYVDSGSTDASCEIARKLGADVVNLDLTRPFTAARARNAGYRRALELFSDLYSIMFVDGDCVISEGFVEFGDERLRKNAQLAIVVGQLREQFPDASVYNRLCDMEWRIPAGQISECGGNALIRVQALLDVDGYREDLIAGEEPEMCVRMSGYGWMFECVDQEMGFHDARMTKFSQWWKRMVRCGHAYAEGAALHGQGPTRHYVKQLKSTLFWGIAVPVGAVACLAMSVFSVWLMVGFLVWPLGWAYLFRKVRSYRLAQGDSPNHARTYAGFCVVGKLANGIGVIKYYWNRFMGRRSKIIEY